MSETPDDLKNAVKSDNQAQGPAAPQLAETVIDTTQSVPQSAEPTLGIADRPEIDHAAWSVHLRHLQSDRDTYARVCTSYVLEEKWELATYAAREAKRLQGLIDDHLEELRNWEAQNDAD